MWMYLPAYNSKLNRHTRMLCFPSILTKKKKRTYSIPAQFIHHSISPSHLVPPRRAATCSTSCLMSHLVVMCVMRDVMCAKSRNLLIQCLLHAGHMRDSMMNASLGTVPSLLQQSRNAVPYPPWLPPRLVFSARQAFSIQVDQSHKSISRQPI